MVFSHFSNRRFRRLHTLKNRKRLELLELRCVYDAGAIETLTGIASNAPIHGNDTLDFKISGVSVGNSAINSDEFARMDINGDGMVQPLDPLILINRLAAMSSVPPEDALDVNLDGQVNERDFDELVRYLNFKQSSESLVTHLSLDDLFASAYGQDQDQVTSEAGVFQANALVSTVNGEPPSPSDNLVPLQNNEIIVNPWPLWMCCKDPGQTEPIKWELNSKLASPVNAALDLLKQQLGGSRRPFENLSIPIPLQGTLVQLFPGASLSIPLIPDYIRDLTISDLVDLVVGPAFAGLKAAEDLFYAEFGSYRDDLSGNTAASACGCNMLEPTLDATGTGTTLTGIVVFDSGVEKVGNTEFPDDHRYPRIVDGWGPGHPHYNSPENRGNLVDEYATIKVRPFLTIGIDVTISILGTSVPLRETLNFVSKNRIENVRLVCSRGTKVEYILADHSNGGEIGGVV